VGGARQGGADGSRGRGPLGIARDVVTLTFRGSRADLARATGLRLEAALVLIFFSARCVHLGQAGVDLALAGRSYTDEPLAIGLSVACLVESVAVAGACLRAGSLRPGALLADATFGAVALMVMSAACSTTPDRAGSLNWMLPYTVATSAGLGLFAAGDLVERRGKTGAMRRWPAVVALGLSGVYVVSELLPHRLHDEHLAQILGNAANYAVFFIAAFLAKMFVRRRLSLIASRNAEVTRAAAEVAHAAQWRAAVVDVFGPVVTLLDRVADAEDGQLPPSIRQEADRLISMIEAVRPLESDSVSL
jgi:hypothetical protein